MAEKANVALVPSLGCALSLAEGASTGAAKPLASPEKKRSLAYSRQVKKELSSLEETCALGSHCLKSRQGLHSKA